MTFDRFDVCEAWYLYLSTRHGGQDSREYARLSRLLTHFKPRPSLKSARDLTDNALEIYLQLIEYPHDYVLDGCEGHPLFEMWAGAYGGTKALVRADSFESAFEAFSEWLDENAPGCLTRVNYDDAAKELGYESAAAAEQAGEEAIEEVREQAEMDMTVIGHTTLKNGDAIPSWEWGGGEVEL